MRNTLLVLTVIVLTGFTLYNQRQIDKSFERIDQKLARFEQLTNQNPD